MESLFIYFFFPCEFSVIISFVCIKLKYGSHAIYVHKIRYDTAVSIYVLRWLSTLTTLVSGSVTEKITTKKKTLPKLECADKKLLEESCVWNFRNPLFAKSPLFEILGHFQKLFWTKILGVRNFRVFEILGHLPYFMLQWLLHILHQCSIIIGLYDTKSQCCRYSH